MKLTLTRTQLNSLIRSASPAVAKSTTIPALKCYKLALGHAGDDLTAHLSAYDPAEGLSIMATSPCEADDVGSCLIPAETLSTIAKLAPDGPITFTSGKTLEIKYKGGNYKIPLEDVKNFSSHSPPDSGLATNLEVPAIAIARILSRVAFAATKKDSAHVATTCVLLEGNGSELVAAATDTKRLAVASTKLDAETKTFSVLIPERGVRAAVSIFTERGENVRVQVWSNAIAFTTPTISIQSALNAGKFLLWRKLFHEKRPSRSVITDSPGSLLAAIRRASVTADDLDSSLVWRCTGANLVLSMAGKSGEGEVEHAAKSHQGDAETIEAKFFPKSMCEFLSAASGEQVESLTLAVKDKDNPAYFECDGGNWRYMEMPMTKRGE
jgi:DNA polymerase III sliding clamp (beta) subunit (PCNA family)